MHKDEDALGALVKGLDVQISPSPSHRRELRRRMLDAFDQKAAIAGRPESVRAGKTFRLRFQVAAAAVILLALAGAAWLLVGGGVSRAAASFAEILRQVRLIQSASYEMTLKIGDGAPTSRRVWMASNPRRLRTTMADGKTLVVDYGQGQTLLLSSPEKKEAARPQMASLRDEDYDPIESLRNLHESDGRFLGKRSIAGRNFEVYEVQSPSEKITVWADPAANLPFRLEIAKTTDGGKTTVHMVVERFEWDSTIDNALFSTDLPSGYAWSDTGNSPATENDLVDTLRFMAESSGGFFPVKMDLKTLSSLVEKGLRGSGSVSHAGEEGVVITQVDDKTKLQMKTLLKGLKFVEAQAGHEWRYCGKGVKLGEHGKLVCYWRHPESQAFRAIYGDLEIRDSAAVPNEPK